MAAHVIRLTMTSVASSLFEVVGSLQCKTERRVVGTATRLFIPNKRSNSTQNVTTSTR